MSFRLHRSLLATAGSQRPHSEHLEATRKIHPGTKKYEKRGEEAGEK
jgi:hypothetical protein